MAELTYRDAVIRGIAQEMARDPDVVFLGEDVAKAGGVFKATVGLYEQFGPLRVRDTPISEQAIMGAAMGAAMTGLKPIAEIMFSDFFAVCFDYIANEFPKSRYMSNGQVKCPLVVRTGNGAGSRFGAQHSQSVENWCMMIPGLKVVAPSTPLDVVGLLGEQTVDRSADRPVAQEGDGNVDGLACRSRGHQTSATSRWFSSRRPAPTCSMVVAASASRYSWRIGWPRSISACPSSIPSPKPSPRPAPPRRSSTCRRPSPRTRSWRRLTPRCR